MSEYRSLEEYSFGDTSGDYGQWLGLDLFTEGETLDECLDNATYFLIDQDGGSVGERPADDSTAQAYITKWWNEGGK